MPSGRLTRAFPLVGGALAPSLLCLVLGACTTQAPAPQPNSPSASSASGGSTLGEGMTAVPEQDTCFVEKDLSPDLQLQPGELWPGAAQERSVAQRFTRRDVAGCAPSPKPPADCERGAFPWVLSQDRETYAWSGARKVVAGIAAARLAAGTDLGEGNVALEYVLLRFDPGDPARATTGRLLADLVRRCGHARPGSLGGVKGLVATQPSFFGSGNPAARGVLVSEGDDLLWVLLDGGPWSSQSERRAVGLASERLRAG
jgi:hypothetical protein